MNSPQSPYAPPKSNVEDVIIRSEILSYPVFPIERIFWMSILSSGIFLAYWVYKIWQHIRDHDGSSIRPFWRGIFSVFYIHSLFKRIGENSLHQGKTGLGFAPKKQASFIVLAIVGGKLLSGWQPGSWQLFAPSAAIHFAISFVLIPMLMAPVQRYLNAYMAETGELKPLAFTGGQIFCAVFGVLLWIFAIVGAIIIAKKS